VILYAESLLDDTHNQMRPVTTISSTDWHTKTTFDAL